MTTSVSDQPKHQIVADHLRQMIASGQLQPGDRLPSYRALMKQHRVPPDTVRLAMSSLQADDMIRTIPGVGSVVETFTEPRLMVGVVIGRMGGRRQSSQNRMRDLLIREVSQLHDELDRCGCDLALRFVDSDDDSAFDTLSVWMKRIDAVLLATQIPDALVQRILDADRPALVLGEPDNGPCPAELSHIGFDVDEVATRSVHELTVLGHRRLAFWSHRGTHYFDSLLDCVKRAIQSSGHACRLDVHAGTIHEETTADQIVRWLDERPEPPTAVIVENGGRASELLTALRQAGRNVPGDISLVAISNSDSPQELTEGISSVLLNTRDLMMRAVNLLPEVIQFRGQRVIRQTMPSRWSPGRTCAPPAHHDR